MANILMTKPGLDDSNVSWTPEFAAAKSDSGLGGTGGVSPLSNEQIAKNSGYIFGTSTTPQTTLKTEASTMPGWIGGYRADDPNRPTYTAPPVTTPTNTLTSAPAAADSNATADLIKQEQQALREALQAQTGLINADYDIRGRQLNETQGEENKTNAAVQFRLGREATDFASSSAQKLNQLHQDQQAQMSLQRQALIQQANSAYMNGNVQLAKDLITNAQNVAKAQADAAQQQRENASRDITDALNKAKLSSDTIKAGVDKIDNLAKSGVSIDQVSSADRAILEENAGLLRGGFEAYYETTQNAAKIKTQQDLIDFAAKVGTLADKIPEGTTQDIPLPDGSIYTVHGTGKVDQSPVHKEWLEYLGAEGVDMKGKTDAQIQREAESKKLPGFNAYQTMDASRKRSVTNNITQTEKLIDKINADASNLIAEMNKTNSGINFAGAFDTLKAKYPNLTNENINELLGGSVPYDEKSGKFDPTQATGNAKKFPGPAPTK